MKSKKVVIIILIILVVICFAIIFLVKGKSTSNTIPNLPKIEEIDNVVENNFFSENINLNELEKLMKDDLVTNFMVYGDDSILRDKPSENVISKYNLTNYVSLQETLASKVEKTFSENLSYTSEETSEGNVEFKIKPWYFSLYSDNISSIIVKIFDLAGLSLEPEKMAKDKYDACYYEAKILAMKILDSHLSDYNNKNEELNFTFYYEDGKPMEHQYFSLYLNLIGATSKVANSSDNENIINDYFNDAINNGIINKDKPLISNI